MTKNLDNRTNVGFCAFYMFYFLQGFENKTIENSSEGLIFVLSKLLQVDKLKKL